MILGRAKLHKLSVNFLFSKAHYYIKQSAEEIQHFTFKPKKRVLFDHIPKCAGTSVNEILIPHYSKRRIFYATKRSRPEYFNMTDQERLRFQLITGHDSRNLINLLPPNFFLTTVLRDPISRVVSLYRYIKRSKYHKINKIILERNYSIADFVRSGVTGETCNFMTRHFSGLDREEVQSNPDYASKLAMTNATKYDLIGTVDYLSSYLKQLSELTGIRVSSSPPFANRSTPSKGSELHNLDIEVVREFNQADVMFYQKIIQHTAQ